MKLKTLLSLIVCAIGLIALSSCVLFSGNIASTKTNSSNSQTQVTANQVKDKDSLKAFVFSAKEHLETNYDQAVKDFREKEEWKKGFIYLYGFTMDGTTLFHIALPELEGNNLLKIPQIGDTIIKPLLSAGKKGGGFAQYTQDNPITEAVDPSKKIGYVIKFKKDGVDCIVGSGFYLDNSK